MILKPYRSLIGRITIIGQNRKIVIRELLQYSLGPLPWSFASTDGFPCKTNKAALANALRKDVQLADGLPRNSAPIINGMSIVQTFNVGGGQTTFGMVASSLLTKVLHEGSESDRIDVVFDAYRDMSLNQECRENHTWRSCGSPAVAHQRYSTCQTVENVPVRGKEQAKSYQVHFARMESRTVQGKAERKDLVCRC